MSKELLGNIVLEQWLVAVLKEWLQPLQILDKDNARDVLQGYTLTITHNFVWVKSQILCFKGLDYRKYLLFVLIAEIVFK